MLAFGRLAPFEYITCLNHTINLAVLDVIFPKKEKLSTDADADECPEDGEEEDESIEEAHVADETFSTTIARMRAIINAFRKSPVKNSLLQDVLAKQNRKKLELTMFTKTRWNSLVISGRRFLELLPAVLATLSELDSLLRWDDDNTELLKVIFSHLSSNI